MISTHLSVDGTSPELACDFSRRIDAHFGTRLASIFVILLCSTFGALFPIFLKRSKWMHKCTKVLDFVRYFGTGIIIATAFVHLLSPALEALSSKCLPPGWSSYPYAMVLCLSSIFVTFIIELSALRWGMKRVSAAKTQPIMSEANVSQIISVAILELGVALHNLLIGLTLAADDEFTTLFIVLVFHQTFEGLGIGTRLVTNVPAEHRRFTLLGAVIFGLTTPVGIAIGLAIRRFYNRNTVTISTISGVIDSLSSGMLIYTGIAELLAHEFLFNEKMMTSSNGHVAMAVGSMLLGCVLMALLGKWV